VTPPGSCYYSLMARKPTDTVHLRLRFGEKLRRRLERAAAENKQSMNAEIIRRLEESFRKQDQKQLITSIVQETLTIIGPRGAVVVPDRRMEVEPEPGGLPTPNQKVKKDEAP
jgi:Arc-like DNA binding domain